MYQKYLNVLSSPNHWKTLFPLTCTSGVALEILLSLFFISFCCLSFFSYNNQMPVLARTVQNFWFMPHLKDFPWITIIYFKFREMTWHFSLNLKFQWSYENKHTAKGRTLQYNPTYTATAELKCKLDLWVPTSPLFFFKRSMYIINTS